MSTVGGAPIHEIDGRGCRFGPIVVRHVLLTHHGACYLDYLLILSFGDSILLGSVSAWEFSPNAFTLEVGVKFVGEVLLSSVRS